MSDTKPRTGMRLVWDWPVRVIHWLLLVAVIGSWVTQNADRDLFRFHVWFGYAVLALVLTRIIWGFVGTRHARFAGFLRGPGTTLGYARSLFSSTSPRYAGHNPLGAWMVVVLLSLLLAQALTGLFANDQIMNTGPLFGHVAVATSDRLTRLHKSIFDWLLIAIGLHVAAAIGYLVFKRQNLILPMITGRKPAEALMPEEIIQSSRAWLALLVLAGVVAIIAYVVRNAPEATLSFF